MTDNVFREYDIRGIVNQEIPLAHTGNLGRAIITYFKQQEPSLSQIVVGMDGRTHSPEMKKNILEAILDQGINVVDIGLCPTPILYFALFNHPTATSGLMITASHNPGQYNGVKICQARKSVWGKQIQDIKQIYKSEKFYTATGNAGTLTTYDACGAYVAWLTNHFAHLKNLEVNAVIDCGNGTAGPIFEKLIPSLGLKNTQLLYAPVDGNFPNHEADPTNIKNMRDVQSFLAKNKTFTVGLGLDGDCDRMDPMTKSGILVPGDQMVALFSRKIVENHPGAPIVLDIKSSAAMMDELQRIGAAPHMAPSGHTVIKEALRNLNAKLAGELSCHFFFNDRYFGYDDGIYAALRLFELLHQSGKSLDELVASLPQTVNTPEYRIPCTEENKSSIVSHVRNLFGARKDASLVTIDGVRAQTDYGWGLIRASNTQPVLCLRFESSSTEGLNHIKKDFTTALQPFFNEKELKEYFES